MTKREFQAVVLAAGRGSRMTELTASRPKCLLPVGQHPVLYHTLKLLEKTGFKDAIIVVLSSAQNQIQSAISKFDLKITPELVAIPSDTSEEWGTAESIHHLMSQDKITSDVVLVTCDLFTNGNLSDLLLKFRQHDASLAALLFEPLKDPTQAEVPPGVKSKFKAEKDIIGIDSETSRLVFLSSMSDFEETVQVKRSILRRHPRIEFRTDLVDAHVYVVSYRLAQFLFKSKHFCTLKGEFLPYVVSKQHTRGKATSELSPKSQVMQDKLTLLQEAMRETKLEETIRDFSSYNDHRGDLKATYLGDSIRCFAAVSDEKFYGIRINSLASLWHANRLVTTLDDAKEGSVDLSAVVKSNQVENSFIGPGSVVHEKTSIRSSVTCEGCTIHPKSRVIQSVLLRKAEIKEGCVIENCIIGNDVKIGENCELKNCIVGSQHEVPPKTKASFKVLTQADRLMEI